MTPPIRPFLSMQGNDDILIVGGGTAGWLTAAYLARRLGTAPGGVCNGLQAGFGFAEDNAPAAPVAMTR